MAGINLIANSGGQAVASSTAETVLQITAAANHRVVLKGFSVTVAGTVAVDMTVRVLRQTTAGTAGTTSGLICKTDPTMSETIQTSAATNFSAEPTAGDVLQYKKLQGAYEKYIPFAQEIHVPGGTRIGLEVTALSAATVAAEFYFEE